MLPFFAAGGAISGASFGLFYTVLMQIGYNHFGKRALKEMEAGADLSTVLMKIQRELQPFTTEIMRIALESMEPTVEKTVNTIMKIVEDRSAIGVHNIKTHLLGLDLSFLGKPLIPSASGHTAGTGAVIVTGGEGDDIINIGTESFKKSDFDVGPPKDRPLQPDDVVRKTDFQTPEERERETTIAKRKAKELSDRRDATLRSNAEKNKAAIALAGNRFSGAEKYWFDQYIKAATVQGKLSGKSAPEQAAVLRKSGYRSQSILNRKILSARGWIQKNSSFAKLSNWLRSK